MNPEYQVIIVNNIKFNHKYMYLTSMYFIQFGGLNSSVLKNNILKIRLWDNQLAQPGLKTDVSQNKSEISKKTIFVYIFRTSRDMIGDVVLSEIIVVLSIILSIVVINGTVEYRKNSDISEFKNLIIQTGIVGMLYFVSKKVDIWSIVTINNDKLADYSILISNKSIDIIVNIAIIGVITFVYNKIYKVEWKKFIFLYLISGQYLKVLEKYFLERFLFIVFTGYTLSDDYVQTLSAQDWNLYNIKLLLITFMLYIFIRIIIKFINRLSKDKMYTYIAYIVIVNLSVILLKIILDSSQRYTSINGEILITATYTMPYMAVLSMIITVYIVMEIRKETEIRIQEKQMYSRLESKNEYYEKIEEAQNQIRRLYHDMNNHLNNIQIMNENSENATKYIESIQNELKQARKKRLSGNAMFDIIIDEKMKVCKEKGIEFTANIDSRNTAFIENIDTSSILSNILDNAIEACEKIPCDKRYIKLETMWADDIFLIVCENSKINSIKKSGETFVTDKINKSNHGIGIKSIEYSVKKYRGNMLITYDENTFNLKIMIPKK